MFKLRNISFLLISILSICSCSSKKNIIYLQDFHGSEISTVDYKTHQIKEGDILKISIEDIVNKLDKSDWHDVPGDGFKGPF